MRIDPAVLETVAKQRSLKEVKMDGLDGADRLELYTYYAEDAKKRKDEKELLGIYHSAAPLLQSKDHPMAKKIRGYIHGVYEDVDYEMRKKYSNLAYIKKFGINETSDMLTKGVLEEQQKFESAIDGLCNVYTVNDLSVSNNDKKNNLFEGVFVTSLINKGPYNFHYISAIDREKSGLRGDCGGIEIKVGDGLDGATTEFYSSSTNYSDINFIGTGLKNKKTVASHFPLGEYRGLLGLGMLGGVIKMGNINGSVAPLAKDGYVSLGGVRGEVGYNSRAHIKITGNVDGDVGKYYCGSTIEVKGRVVGSVGFEMKSGILKVHSHLSNNGGRVGEKMRGGKIIIGRTNRSVGVLATGGEIYYGEIPFNSWFLSRCPASIDNFNVWDVRKLLEVQELRKRAKNNGDIYSANNNGLYGAAFRKLRSARRWGDRSFSKTMKKSGPCRWLDTVETELKARDYILRDAKSFLDSGFRY